MRSGGVLRGLHINNGRKYHEPVKPSVGAQSSRVEKKESLVNVSEAESPKFQSSVVKVGKTHWNEV